MLFYSDNPPSLRASLKKSALVLWVLLSGLMTLGIFYYLNHTPLSASHTPPLESFFSLPSTSLTMKFKPKEVDLLARTIYGEARGEASDKAREAVAHVILNRIRDRYDRWPKTIAAVVLQKNQFSCWNTNDPNYILVKNVTFKDPEFRKAHQIARRVLQSKDPLRGANHFHTVDVQPSWTQGIHTMQRIATINRHIFYKM